MVSKIYKIQVAFSLLNVYFSYNTGSFVGKQEGKNKTVKRKIFIFLLYAFSICKSSTIYFTSSKILEYNPIMKAKSVVLIDELSSG